MFRYCLWMNCLLEKLCTAFACCSDAADRVGAEWAAW